LPPRARPRWRTGADMGARADGLQGRFRGVPVQMWRATGRRTRRHMDTRPTVAPTAQNRRTWSNAGDGRTLAASRLADGLPVHRSGRRRERSNADRLRWRTYGRLAPRARTRWRTGADMGARTDGLQDRFRGVPFQMWRATGRRTRRHMDTRPTVAPTARRIGAHGRTLATVERYRLR